MLECTMCRACFCCDSERTQAKYRLHLWAITQQHMRTHFSSISHKRSCYYHPDPKRSNQNANEIERETESERMRFAEKREREWEWTHEKSHKQKQNVTENYYIMSGKIHNCLRNPFALRCFYTSCVRSHLPRDRETERERRKTTEIAIVLHGNLYILSHQTNKNIKRWMRVKVGYISLLLLLLLGKQNRMWKIPLRPERVSFVVILIRCNLFFQLEYHVLAQKKKYHCKKISHTTFSNEYLLDVLIKHPKQTTVLSVANMFGQSQSSTAL